MDNIIEAMKQALDALEELDASLKQAIAEAEEQKPVAWVFDDKIFWHTSPDLNNYIRMGGSPLYTFPPRRKPLTDEELDAATEKESDDLLDYIYVYGTIAEGTRSRVRKLARAAIDAAMQQGGAFRKFEYKKGA